MEGPSAVGKTTLAAALARTHGAAVVPEPSGDTPPDDPAARAAWLLDRHVAPWQDARAAAASGRVLVVDAGADGPPVAAVTAALGTLPAEAPDAVSLLEQLLAWVGAREPIDR